MTYNEVKVTQENIDSAERGNPRACPIACALQDAGYENYFVGDTGIVFEKDGKRFVLYPLHSAVDFIHNADADKPLETGTLIWDDRSHLASYIEDSLQLWTLDDLEDVDEDEHELLGEIFGLSPDPRYDSY